MKINQFIQQGQREYQQDYLLQTDNLFVLCDGVGGNNKGEVASEQVTSLFTALQKEGEVATVEGINAILEKVQENLNSQLIENPHYSGMGTTFTMLSFNKENISIAHVGDSRIYYIKPNQKKYWRTWDHSLVAELVSQGTITEAEAEVHPMRNRITRAIQAKRDSKDSKADYQFLDFIEPGDLFLQCSDGVLEPFSESELLNILSDETKTLNERFEILKSACAETSSDNNTCFLIEIEETDCIYKGSNDHISFDVISPVVSAEVEDAVEKNSIDEAAKTSVENDDKPAEDNAEAAQNNEDELNPTIPEHAAEKVKQHSKTIKIAIYTFCALLLLASVLALFKQCSNKKQSPKASEQQVNKTNYKGKLTFFRHLTTKQCNCIINYPL